MHTEQVRALRESDVDEGVEIMVVHGSMYVPATITRVHTRTHERREDGKSYRPVLETATGVVYYWRTVTGWESSGSFAPPWVYRDGPDTVAADGGAVQLPRHAIRLADDHDYTADDVFTVPVADVIGCHALLDVAVPDVTDPTEAAGKIRAALVAAGITILGNVAPRPYTDQRVNTYKGFGDDRVATSLGVLEVEAHTVTGNHVGVGTTEYLPPGLPIGSTL